MVILKVNIIGVAFAGHCIIPKFGDAFKEHNKIMGFPQICLCKGFIFVIFKDSIGNFENGYIQKRPF